MARVPRDDPPPRARVPAGQPLAWRRLRRNLAELALDRRRDAFARDRALADAGADGFRLAG